MQTGAVSNFNGAVVGSSLFAPRTLRNIRGANNDAQHYTYGNAL
jgi:hypothetical protein